MPLHLIYSRVLLYFFGDVHVFHVTKTSTLPCVHMVWENVQCFLLWHSWLLIHTWFVHKSFFSWLPLGIRFLKADGYYSIWKGIFLYTSIWYFIYRLMLYLRNYNTMYFYIVNIVHFFLFVLLFFFSLSSWISCWKWTPGDDGTF